MSLCCTAQNEAYQQLTFLIILFYSPLVQAVASMQRCDNDPDHGWVLSADPRISCEESDTRFSVNLHASTVVSYFGLGLPMFVLWKMRDLSEKKKLTADSNYAGLFEWYSPRRPYWVAVLLAKPLCLVLVADTVITDPLTQARSTSSIWPSSRRSGRSSTTFKKQNLFHVLERGSSVAGVIGSIVAVLGAEEADLVDLVGELFAGVNFVYVVGGALLVREGHQTEGAAQFDTGASSRFWWWRCGRPSVGPAVGFMLAMVGFMMAI